MISFEIRNLRLIQGECPSQYHSAGKSQTAWDSKFFVLFFFFFLLLPKQFSGFLGLTNGRNGIHSYFQKLKMLNDYTACSQAAETHSESDCLGLGSLWQCCYSNSIFIEYWKEDTNCYLIKSASKEKPFKPICL